MVVIVPVAQFELNLRREFATISGETHETINAIDARATSFQGLNSQ